MLNKQPVYIHACGVLSALGNNINTFQTNLMSQLSPGMQPDSTTLIDDQTTYTGHVTAKLPLINENRFNSRNNQLALAALNQIDADIKAAIARFGYDRVAVIVGTSTGGVDEGGLMMNHLAEHGQRLNDYCYEKQETGNLAEFIAEQYQITGPTYIVSTACTSGGRVYASAKRMLNTHLVDAVIVGGVDTLCSLTINGFHALDAMSSERCQPFGKHRDGINLGEAGALMILRRDKPDHPRPVALMGYGDSSDAHHISAPHPEGRGAISAMEKALDDANIDKGDIGYINAHGTSTPLNDKMEAKAIYAVFGDTVPTSSTKRLTGHTLGAASAIEAYICWNILHHQLPLPAQSSAYDIDDTIAPIQLAKPDMALNKPYILSNSFAFGGNNISLIFGVCDD